MAPHFPLWPPLFKNVIFLFVNRIAQTMETVSVQTNVIVYQDGMVNFVVLACVQLIHHVRLVLLIMDAAGVMNQKNAFLVMDSI